jgi:hypothetical protein
VLGAQVVIQSEMHGTVVVVGVVFFFETLVGVVSDVCRATFFFFCKLGRRCYDHHIIYLVAVASTYVESNLNIGCNHLPYQKW